ncbi:Uncharacterized protein dnl_20850 [Desulfonema limicola]|uniref:Uncharacterized protein n=1 Tax=Desulfonema limicola TaxID=45656 RepID=A0A975B6N4_9BACT|nr:Uncharacterized protein dnl_20850 [Desulfonema limicola]
MKQKKLSKLTALFQIKILNHKQNHRKSFAQILPKSVKSIVI